MTDSSLRAADAPDHSNGVDDCDDAPLPPIPILRTFAKAKPVRLLSGLAELSFVAGREGDDYVDWFCEAQEALIDGFKFQNVSRVDWLDTAQAALGRAFDAGVAQRAIDRAEKAPSARSMAVANAHALIYLDEVEFPDDACPSAIDSAVSYVAYKLAERHPLSPAEAAHIAMLAFRENGMQPSLEVASRALNRAEAGHEERVAVEERAARRANAARVATSSIFGDA